MKFTVLANTTVISVLCLEAARKKIKAAVKKEIKAALHCGTRMLRKIKYV